MANDNPTNSELKIMLDNLIEKSDQRHLDYKETHNKMIVTLDQILEQAKKTNGRVSRLEYWQGAMKWGFGIGFPFITGIIIKVFF